MTIDLTTVSKRNGDVPVAELTPAPFNPPSRADDDLKFKRLRADMAANGQLSPIHVVADDAGRLYIAEGHRRVAAIKELGGRTAKAIIYQGGKRTREVVEAIFVAHNHALKALTLNQQLEVAVRDGPVFSRRIRADVALLEQMFGKSLDKLLRTHPEYVSGSLLDTARAVATHVYHQPPRTAGHAEKVKRVLTWLAKWHLQADTRHYLKLHVQYGRLMSAIERDQRHVPGIEPRVKVENGQIIALVEEEPVAAKKMKG